MKKEDLELGMKIFTDALRDKKVRLDYKEDVCYLRKLDGAFSDKKNKERYIMGYVLITEDPEKLELLDKMVIKGIEKRNIKFENLGEVD